MCICIYVRCSQRLKKPQGYRVRIYNLYSSRLINNQLSGFHLPNLILQPRHLDDIRNSGSSLFWCHSKNTDCLLFYLSDKSLWKFLLNYLE